MIISSSVVFVILILMWDWDQQGFQFLNKPNKFEKKKNNQLFKRLGESIFHTEGAGGDGQREGVGSGARRAALWGLSLCLRHAPGTRAGRRGWLPRAVPTWGTARWPNPGQLTKGTLPLTPP